MYKTGVSVECSRWPEHGYFEVAGAAEDTVPAEEKIVGKTPAEDKSDDPDKEDVDGKQMV